ncbi:uncharacterized protein LOC107416273 [Ziziphus jujuba]|uniref:Uncharacterized protein LOC107416273 n=2 Tax=Ziziphus jujuba TaxID=326968 RepID=A0A6P3ZX70_ZIZJJ|nr:uncharacterized protein LOC107416273 [Ziziphus jujuba]KAH7533742.1 hypothetical protein FEM48_Zijuj04G0164000 [Ziziphus jujuba var. spinosa]
MEESSNGKLEETQKVDLQEEEGKKASVEDVGDSNPVGESGGVIDIVDISEFQNKRDVKIEDFSESVDETLGAKDSSSSTSSSDEEKETAVESTQMLDSEQLEEAKKILESIEPPADSETIERNEKSFPSLDEPSGESSPFVSDLPSKEIDGKTLQNSEKSNGFPAVVTDLASHSSFENENESKSVVETSVVAMGIEETGLTSPDEKKVDDTVVTESTAREENSGQSSAQVVECKPSSDNGGEVCDKPETSESTVNPTFVPVSRRSLEPTSWRGCCGLFEVLRRSNR